MATFGHRLKYLSIARISLSLSFSIYCICTCACRARLWHRRTNRRVLRSRDCQTGYTRRRAEALRVLRVVLEEYQVVGMNANIAFLLAIASHPAFVAAKVETGFIPVRLCKCCSPDVVQ